MKQTNQTGPVIATYEIDSEKTVAIVMVLCLLLGIKGGLLAVFRESPVPWGKTFLFAVGVGAGVGVLMSLILLAVNRYYSVRHFQNGLLISDIYGLRKFCAFAEMTTIKPISIFGFEYAQITARDRKVYYLPLFVAKTDRMIADLGQRLGKHHPLTQHFGQAA